MIPYGRHHVEDEDERAVLEVLRSDFLTQGPVVPRFEQAVAAYCGAAHAVSANSATSSLHVACLALGVGPGDRVWTSPVTFLASSNCALYCGASVDFVDVDPATANMSVQRLAEKLEVAKREGNLPKVVIPVHLGGQSCDMKGIHELAQRYGFHVVEDASHAVGGRYRGEPVGNCRYSDITVFSFHPVKIITTAEGGMALTNDARLARRLRLFCSHGMTREQDEMTRESDGPWYYQMVELGYNYRMTELHAALGLSQLQRIDGYVATRHAISKRYDQLLEGLPVTPLRQEPDAYSGLHLYIIQLELDRIRRTHREVFEALRAGGVGVNLHYIPVYLQPYYERLGFRAGHCPAAEQYYARAISLPMFPQLDAARQDRVVAALREALGT